MTPVANPAAIPHNSALMRWLLHGSLSPAVAQALLRHKQVVNDLAQAGLVPNAPAEAVLRLAAQRQWDIITNDPNLARQVFDQPVRLGRCIVLLQLAGGEVEQDDAIDRLFARYRRLSPGRLYTVTESRVKVRQLPRGS